MTSDAFNVLVTREENCTEVILTTRH